jgi:hypothetical protein
MASVGGCQPEFRKNLYRALRSGAAAAKGKTQAAGRKNFASVSGRTRPMDIFRPLKSVDEARDESDKKTMAHMLF